MQNEQNGSTGVSGNGTVNLSILVLCIGLWPLHEMLGCYMLNIIYSYNPW
jgi:hypothetical protein